MVIVLASSVTGKMSGVVGNGPCSAMTNTRPFRETFRHLPVAQPLRRIGILKLYKKKGNKTWMKRVIDSPTPATRL